MTPDDQGLRRADRGGERGGGDGGEHDHELGIRPLTARSVLLSVLLGSHPPELPARALVRAGAIFGIPDGTVRVALSRMAGDGDVVADNGSYRLSGRLLDRQRRQDEGRAAVTLPWDGSWDLVVADPGVRSVAAREGLDHLVVPLRMAEWRDGVWTRPANLEHPWRPEPGVGLRRTRIEPVDRPAALAADLWDLDGWSRRARHLLTAMRRRPDPARHFTVSAAVVAHLRDDPLLPAALLPADWPGPALRERYAAFEEALMTVLRTAGSPDRAANPAPRN